MQKFVFPRIILPITLGLTGLVLMEARAAAVVSAMPITLAWKAANDPTVSGYAIYYGPTNQPATNRVDAGTGTSVTLFGLKANVGYRFFAVSYSAAGLQSVPSNELLLAPPAISRLQLARKADGSMQLNAKAAPGTTCSILFTSKLQPAAWQPLAQTTADQVGNIIAVDASAAQANSRFYRLVLGAQPLFGPLQIQRQADGNMLLSMKAPPGTSCRLLYASAPNPLLWQTLKNVTADADGNAAVLDATARLSSRRFYRMAMP